MRLILFQSILKVKVLNKTGLQRFNYLFSHPLCLPRRVEQKEKQQYNCFIFIGLAFKYSLIFRNVFIKLKLFFKNFLGVK